METNQEQNIELLKKNVMLEELLELEKLVLEKQHKIFEVQQATQELYKNMNKRIYKMNLRIGEVKCQ